MGHQSTAPRVSVPLLIVFGTLSGIGPLATDMYLAAFPRMSEDLDTQASTIQLTLSACMLGLALGQLLIGPLSDQWGRRRPLMIGSAVCFLASLGCALAPTVEVLIGFRLLMGLSGAAGIVLARSMIADLTVGTQTTRYMNYMMMINGLATVLAPTVGGLILAVSTWRTVFWVLTAVTLLMAAAVFVLVPESLPAERRHSGGLRTVGRGVAAMVRRPRYVGFVIAFVLSFGTLFSYISGSTYVLQNVLGMSSTAYALAFGANSLGILLFSVLSNALLSRTVPERIAPVGLSIVAVSALTLLGLTLAGALSLPVVLVLLFLCAGCQGLIFGNITSLALSQGRDYAGAASALLGCLQFGMGGLVSPLVGLGGDHAVAPMAISMSLCALAALTVFLTTRARTTPHPQTT